MDSVSRERRIQYLRVFYGSPSGTAAWLDAGGGGEGMSDKMVGRFLLCYQTVADRASDGSVRRPYFLVGDKTSDVVRRMSQDGTQAGSILGTSPRKEEKRLNGEF